MTALTRCPVVAPLTLSPVGVSFATVKSETTIDFVPSEFVRKGGLFFTRDARPCELQLRPLHYHEP